MEKPSGRSSRRIFFNCLKTVAFLIWVTCPILLLTLAIGMEYQTVIEMKWFISIAITGFIFFSIYWIWNYYKRHTTQTIQKIKIKDFGIAIGLFLLLRIVAVIGTLLNEYFTGNTMTSNDAALQTNNPLGIFPFYFVLFNLSLGIFSPILEELAFRGIFVDIWFSSGKKWLPAVITSGIFSLAHGLDNVITFSMYFTMGVVFYYAYCRRGNIKDAILLHILNNGLIMIASFVFYLLLHLNSFK